MSCLYHLTHSLYASTLQDEAVNIPSVLQVYCVHVKSDRKRETFAILFIQIGHFNIQSGVSATHST